MRKRPKLRSPDGISPESATEAYRVRQIRKLFVMSKVVDNAPLES